MAVRIINNEKLQVEQIENLLTFFLLRSSSNRFPAWDSRVITIIQ